MRIRRSARMRLARRRVYFAKDMAAQKDGSRWLCGGAISRRGLPLSSAAVRSRPRRPRTTSGMYFAAPTASRCSPVGLLQPRGPFHFVHHNRDSIHEEMNRCPTT